MITDGMASAPSRAASARWAGSHLPVPPSSADTESGLRSNLPARPAASLPLAAPVRAASRWRLPNCRARSLRRRRASRIRRAPLGCCVRCNRWQFLGSYAYSSDVGDNFGTGFNNDNPLGNYGPLNIDFRHILNLSGLVQLPLHFQLAVVVVYNSRPPFSAFLGGLDLNGDGTTGDLLPGTTVNQFNRGLGKLDLAWSNNSTRTTRT